MLWFYDVIKLQAFHCSYLSCKSQLASYIKGYILQLSVTVQSYFLFSSLFLADILVSVVSVDVFWEFLLQCSALGKYDIYITKIFLSMRYGRFSVGYMYAY